MPDSGGGTVTPIPPPSGGPTITDIVSPLPWTILSLDFYAKIMGVNPAHFWGATAPNLTPTRMPVDQCGSIYHQYSWQDSDKISRYDIAVAIRRAEQDIANALGYWPGLVWVDEEKMMFERPYRREYFGTGWNIRAMPKSVKARWGEIYSVGKRAVSLVGTATVVASTLSYVDNDGDGFYETAQIELPTTATDPREIRVYFAGFDGDPEYEIREPRRVTISGGVVTLLFDAWLFIRRDIYEEPTSEDGEAAVDISTTDDYVTSVDVYREYPDLTEESCVLYWENYQVGCASCGGVGCDACGYVSQDGCMHVRDHHLGIVVPNPASYDSETGLWTEESFSGGREPDWIQAWYRAGKVSREFLAQRSTNPLNYEFARIIAHLATARFERPLCGCSNVHTLSERLMKDIASNEGTGGMFFTSVDLVNNPFGSRVGEVEAWRYLTKLEDRIVGVAVL